VRTVVRRATRPMMITGTVVAIGLLLSACTNGGSGAPATPGTSSAAPKPVTLVVPTSQAPWNPAYAKVIAAYEAETGNKVDLRPFPNPDVKTQQINDIQGQQHTFDVYQINESDVAQFNANGWIQKLTDIDPAFKPDDAILSFSNIARWNQAKQTFTSDGDLTIQPLAGNVDIFMYRTDIYSQLGLSVPKTWDEVISNGQKIMAAGAGKYGGVFRTQGTPGASAISFEFTALLNGAGGAWFTDVGTNWKPTPNNAAGVKAATWLQELAKLGPAATTTIGQAQAIAAMQSGDAAQTFLVAAAAQQLEDPANSSVSGKIGYAEIPRTPSGQSSSITGLWTLAVPAGLPADRSQAALSYIKWMTSAKAMTLFAQNGGIPIRSDAFSPSGISPSMQSALNVVKSTSEGLPEKPTGFRYPFAGDVLNVTEAALGDIAAGTVTPAAGMATIETGLQAVVTKNNLPVS